MIAHSRSRNVALSAVVCDQLVMSEAVAVAVVAVVAARAHNCQTFRGGVGLVEMDELVFCLPG